MYGDLMDCADYAKLYGLEYTLRDAMNANPPPHNLAEIKEVYGKSIGRIKSRKDFDEKSYQGCVFADYYRHGLIASVNALMGAYDSDMVHDLNIPRSSGFINTGGGKLFVSAGLHPDRVEPYTKITACYTGLCGLANALKDEIYRRYEVTAEVICEK